MRIRAAARKLRSAEPSRLRPDEEMLALEMIWVFQRGGESLVFLSILFNAECFGHQCVIKAGADFEGFAIEVQDVISFSASLVAG